MRFALIILATLSIFPTNASAQDVYKNTCDPAQYTECRDLSDKYQDGVAPFPQDPVRADVLLNLALDYARENCGAGQGQACYSLSQHFQILSFTQGTSNEEYLNQLVALRALAKTGCAVKNSGACAFLSTLVASDYRNLQLNALVVQTRGQDDQIDQLDQLRTDLDTEANMWAEQAQTLSQTTFDTLRPNCGPASPEVCGASAYAARYIENPAPDRLGLYHQACLGGAPQYCKNINAFSINDNGPDTEALFKLDLEQACFDGLAEACAARAAIFLFAEQDLAAPLRDRACALGHSKTCGSLGRRAFSQYRKSSDSSDLQRASDFLDKACAGGDAISCHYMEHISKG